MVALDHDTALVLIAAIGALSAAGTALVNNRRGIRIEERLKDGNGDDTNIGELVYDLDKKIEVVLAQQHEAKATVAAMREEYLARFERLETKAQAQNRRHETKKK